MIARARLARDHPHAPLHACYFVGRRDAHRLVKPLRSQAQVGAIIGVSRGRVAALELEALRKIRSALFIAGGFK